MGEKIMAWLATLQTALRRYPDLIAFGCLVLILVGGWNVRSVGRSNWDGPNGTPLIHPDEYHVGDRVTLNLRVPDTFSAYLRSECDVITQPDGTQSLINPRDPALPLDQQEPSPNSGCNTLNPRNLNFAREHVYGSWPTTMVRYTAEKIYTSAERTPDQITRNQIVVLGRIFGTLMDLFILVMVYLIGRYLDSRALGLVAALLYAGTALLIQQSHYYTVDLHAAAYGMLSLYFCLRLAHGGGWKAAVGAGLGLGLAVAAKINMGAFVLIVILAAMQGAWQQVQLDSPDPWSPKAIWTRLWSVFSHAFGWLVLAAVVTLITLRFTLPDAFVGSTVFDLRLESRFLRAVGNAQATASAEVDFPPSHQFANRTKIVHAWANMVVWGTGIPLGLAAWLGWLGMGIGLLRRASRHLVRWLPLWAWVSFYFFWQASQPIQPMRYMIPIYGPFILLAAWGLVALVRWARREERPRLFRRVPLQAISLGIASVVLVSTLLWGWGFSRIFERTHPRIAASEWVKRNIPPGSVISSDAWDIGVPHLDGNLWPGVQVPITDEDNPAKLEALLNTLDQVDYLAFTTNRAYGSLPQLPMRFPMSLNYFRGVFEETLGFEKVADFTSFPSFLGVEFSDEWADESWSVYDHPRVTIWQKTPAYNRESARQLLLEDVNLAETYGLKPIDATPIVNMLQLTTERWLEQRAAGSWTETFNGWANTVPLIAWLLLIEIIGLAAWGLLWRLRLPFPDRGLSAARMAGLLALAWLAWFPPALGLWAYSRFWIVLVAVLLIAAGGWSIWRQRAEIWAWIQIHKRAVLVGQGLYWAGFGLLLLIRILNPDLWHPAMGGEKPMNLAYLIATLKSQEFPPYDPWFAGGYMNYYYWGYVLVGTPMKLLGLDPAYGFNLALPLLYGLGAQLAGGIGYNLLAPMRRVVPHLERRATWVALAAAVAVLLLGNLAQVVLYVNAYRTLGNPDVSFSNPEQNSQNLWLNGGSPFADLISGINTRLDGTPLPLRTEWPYWNATRIVPGTINEFPFFSYLYGDLHAHVIGLPLTLFTLLLVVGMWRGRRRGWRALLGFAAALGFCVGALQATNSWDYPTYAVLTAVGVLVVAVYQSQSLRWSRRWWYVLGSVAVWYAALKALWLPFTTYLATGSYDSLQFVISEPHITLREFFVLYGLWFWILVPFVFVLIQRLWGTKGLLVTLAAWGLWFVAAWSIAPAITMPGPAPAEGIGQLIWKLRTAVITEPLRQRSALLLLILPWTIIAGTLLAQALRRRVRPREVLPLAWLTAALGLLIFLEIVVLPGAGRMNVVFKFGYQVWTFFAVAAATVLPTMFTRAPHQRALPAWRIGWSTVALLLLLGSLVYPATATPAKVSDRYVPDAPRGLDGMAWMDGATWDENGPFGLNADALAIRWLRQNVAGTPVLLEGVTSPYRWNTRIATWTGLPTIIGWDGHQAQQRAPTQALPIVDRRKDFVREIYTTPDPQRAQELLDLYGVGLIYVGPLERNVYAGGNIAVFDQLAQQGVWQVIFERDDVRIYERTATAPVPASLPPDFHPGLPHPDPLKRISLDVPPGDLPRVNSTNGWPWLGKHQWAAVLLWLLFFEVVGLLAWPIAALIFRSQAAAAWGFSRVVGLLLLGWLIWFPTSLGMIKWTQGAVLGGMIVLALLGWLAWRQGGATRIKATWRFQRRTLLATEAVFVLLFAVWTLLRALNPDVWHPIWGGEKPFEFGFFNAIVRSPHMPPVDPFYAGGTVNYYYYGLYLMTLPLKLLGLDTAIGFNLAVATVGALVGVTAWSVGLLIGRRLRFALLSLLLVALMGNLAGVIPSGQSSGIYGLVQAASGDGSLINQLGSGVPWFWGPSRVLSPNATVINEFPVWSIIFADLHPHLIALPITLLIIGLAWEASRRQRKRVTVLTLGLAALGLGALIAANAWDVPGYALLIVLALILRGWSKRTSFRWRVARSLGWALVGVGVVLGAAVLYAPFLGAYRAPVGGIWPIRIGSPLLPWLLIYGPFLLVITGWLLAPRGRRSLAVAHNPQDFPPVQESLTQPLEANQPQAALQMINKNNDAETLSHEDHHEADLTPSVLPTQVHPPTLVQDHATAELERANYSDAPVEQAGPQLAAADTLQASVDPMLVVTAEGRTNRWIWVLAAFLIVVVLFLVQLMISHFAALEAILSASVGIRLVVLGLLALLVPALFKRTTDPVARWAVLLATLGALIALGVESVFVRDHLAPATWESGPGDYERMNTVFKFGVQVWVLWALAAALLVPQLLQRLRRTNKVAYGVWASVLGLLGVMMLVFPVFGSLSRIGTRFETPPPGMTLDGLAFMSTATYSPDDLNISLHDDGEAIKWLSREITGTPVLLQSEEEFYRTYGIRVAANTGLPTIISALHGSEQRPAATVDPRIRDVQRIYSLQDPLETQWLLHRYAVDYVYVGSLERQRYPVGVQKFEQLPALEQVYQEGDVTIYRTTPDLRQLAFQWRPDRPVTPSVIDSSVPPKPTQQPGDNPDLRTALERYEQEPNNVGYAFEAGRQLWNSGDSERAAAILRTTADANPNDVALHHLLSDVLISLGRFEEAVTALEQGYTAGPSPENLNKLGEGYLAWSAIDDAQLGEAERVFKQVLAEKPEHSDAYYLLGETYLRQGQRDQAREQYQRYLELAPADGLWTEMANIRLETLE